MVVGHTEDLSTFSTSSNGALRLILIAKTYSTTKTTVKREKKSKHTHTQPVTDDADWETGQDSFEQILDSIETFIAEAKDRKQGGTGNVAGSQQANRGGLVSVGNQAYPY